MLYNIVLVSAVHQCESAIGISMRVYEPRFVGVYLLLLGSPLQGPPGGRQAVVGLTPSSPEQQGQWARGPTLCRAGAFILNPASLQWTHMFLLIEDQGAQGYELFFKTRELKKKWMEQFEMAM